jgi:hypothetical protein
MTLEHAKILFDAMGADRQARVSRIFDQICKGFPKISDAFTEAVADECEAIEIQMLLEQETEDAA